MLTPLWDYKRSGHHARKQQQLWPPSAEVAAPVTPCAVAAVTLLPRRDLARRWWQAAGPPLESLVGIMRDVHLLLLAAAFGPAPSARGIHDGIPFMQVFCSMKYLWRQATDTLVRVYFIRLPAFSRGFQFFCNSSSLRLSIVVRIFSFNLWDNITIICSNSDVYSWLVIPVLFCFSMPHSPGEKY